MLIAYQVRQGGADEATVRIFSIAKKKPLEDELPSALYDSITFTPDGKGLYYARTDRKGTLLYLHAIGTRIADDKLIFGREFHGELLGPIDLFRAEITDDARYLVITIERGVPAKRVDICFRDLTKPGSPFEVLVWGLDSRFSTIYAKGALVRPDRLQLAQWPHPACRSRHHARGMEDHRARGQRRYRELLHRWRQDLRQTAQGCEVRNQRLHARRQTAGTIDYEGIGSASGVVGRTTDRYGFFSFESYIQPPTIYRLDTLTGKREVFAQPKIPFDTDQYELKQVFFKSKDGTQIPMFIAGKKGLKQDGSERLLMTGYGGFNLSETPGVESRVGLVDPAGRMVRCPQPPRRRRVRRTLARAGHVREKAERLRRLVRCRALSHRQQVHLAAALRHPGPLQWRLADGRVHHAASRIVFGRVVRLSACWTCCATRSSSKVRTGPPNTAPPKTRSSFRISTSTRPIRT